MHDMSPHRKLHIAAGIKVKEKITEENHQIFHTIPQNLIHLSHHFVWSHVNLVSKERKEGKSAWHIKQRMTLLILDILRAVWLRIRVFWNVTPYAVLKDSPKFRRILVASSSGSVSKRLLTSKKMNVPKTVPFGVWTQRIQNECCNWRVQQTVNGKEKSICCYSKSYW
jgi:hypothetical protein